MADDRAQCVAHETGQGKYGNQTPSAVTQFGGDKQQAEVTDQGDDQSRMRQLERDCGTGCGGCEQQGHRKQHVGVADHFVAGEHRSGGGWACGARWQGVE